MSSIRTPLIHLEGISQSFGVRHIFSWLSLDISEGDISILTGPSGSGKSTFLSLASGLMYASEGKVIYTHGTDRYDTWESGFRDFYKKYVGTFFTEWTFFEMNSAEENIFFPSLFGGYVQKKWMYNELVEIFELSSMLLRTPLSSLSSGERERVNLVRMFLMCPTILFLDEPFSHLDEHLRTRSLEYLTQYVQDHHVTACIATHSPESFSLGTKKIVFSSGMNPLIHLYA